MALRSVRGTYDVCRLSENDADASLQPMDAEASPRSIASHLRGAIGAWRHAARLALDIALPTLCVACREPVDGEGVCAECWSKLSFIARPYCPRLGIPFVYDPGPELLSMEAIANPPAYARAIDETWGHGPQMLSSMFDGGCTMTVREDHDYNMRALDRLRASRPSIQLACSNRGLPSLAKQPGCGLSDSNI